jgi:hypothetical protein
MAQVDLPGILMEIQRGKLINGTMDLSKQWLDTTKKYQKISENGKTCMER